MSANDPRTVVPWPSRWIIAGMVLLIRGYQIAISPWLGNVCRFEPSCSRYMVAALRKYGLFKGTLKGIGRICRCHPWSEGGIDPP